MFVSYAYWLLLIAVSIPIAYGLDEDVASTTMLRASNHRELAVGEWQACSGVSGTCIDTHRYTCSSGTRSGLCPGAANIKCCPAPGGISCSGGGVCMRTATCGGTSRAGLCPGPSSIQCCSATVSVPREWTCCRVECAGLSAGPFGLCASTFYTEYGPTKPHNNCVEKPSASSGAALAGCCAWHQPFCI